MSRKNDENSSIKSDELVFLLAIAGRIDAQCKTRAVKLNNNRQIYHAYAVLDSLSSSYSMFKYFFEVFISNSNNSDLMHEIMTSPEGMAAIGAEVVFLVGFSFLASYYDEDDDEKNKNNKVQQFIVDAWPYVRDVLKGLKNAYKGWRGTVQVLSLLRGADLKYMIVPVGLILGVLAAANRFWLRSIREERKTMKRANSKLLKEISNSSSTISADTALDFRDIKEGDPNSKKPMLALFAAGLGGLIDGMYLYMGVMSLALLPPPAFIAMLVISVIYTVACVVSRIYEEYDYQIDLQVSQTKCKLALLSKKLELSYAKFLVLQELENKTEADWTAIAELKKDISQYIKQFDEQRKILKMLSTHSYLTATLLGIKAGLFVYGVLAGFLFMISSVFLITAAIFPPALLIACIVSGLVLMTAVTAYSIRTHYAHLNALKTEEPYTQILQMKEAWDKPYDEEPVAYLATLFDLDDKNLSDNAFKEALKNGTSPKASPKFMLQEWCEVFRSFFSGISKGNNFATFAETPFMDDVAEHAHDSPVTGMLAFGSAALFSIVLALRALARGLGRDSTKGVNETQEPRGSQDTREAHAGSVNNVFGFFATSRPLSRTPSTRSRSISPEPTAAVMPHVQSSLALDGMVSQLPPDVLTRTYSAPLISRNGFGV